MRSTELALGTAQLGMDYGIANRKGQPDLDQTFNLLDFAMQSGVTLWDTSPVYGTSEEVLGQFLASSKYAPQICTKLPSVTESGLAVSDQTQIYDFVAHSLERSLKTLGKEQIDYYLIHDERDFENFGSELLEVLCKFQERSVLRDIGISVYSPEVALAALKEKPIEMIQVPLNLFEHRFFDVLAIAAERAITVFARSVYLQGLFFLEPDDALRKVPDAAPYLKKLRRLTGSTKRSMGELALCYVRDKPGVSKMVIGVESVEQLETNVQLLSKPPLSSELRLEIGTLFDSVPVGVLNPSLWE